MKRLSYRCDRCRRFVKKPGYCSERCAERQKWTIFWRGVYRKPVREMFRNGVVLIRNA